MRRAPSRHRANRSTRLSLVNGYCRCKRSTPLRLHVRLLPPARIDSQRLCAKKGMTRRPGVPKSRLHLYRRVPRNHPEPNQPKLCLLHYHRDPFIDLRLPMRCSNAATFPFLPACSLKFESLLHF